MSYRLNTNDYKKILQYYDLPIPKTSNQIKNKAEKILADKLCSCIKKIENSNNMEESINIGICTKSVLNKKGLKKTKTLRCKKKRSLYVVKTRKNILK
jgi:hypothetical protein